MPESDARSVGNGLSTPWSVLACWWFLLTSLIQKLPQWGTEDAEIKVPSVENSELTNVLPFKAWSRSDYSHACFAHCQECLPEKVLKKRKRRKATPFIKNLLGATVPSGSDQSLLPSAKERAAGLSEIVLFCCCYCCFGLVKRAVLIHVGEILRYRNHRYYDYYYMRLVD